MDVRHLELAHANMTLRPKYVKLQKETKIFERSPCNQGVGKFFITRKYLQFIKSLAEYSKNFTFYTQNYFRGVPHYSQHITKYL